MSYHHNNQRRRGYTGTVFETPQPRLPERPRPVQPEAWRQPLACTCTRDRTCKVDCPLCSAGKCPRPMRHPEK